MNAIEFIAKPRRLMLAQRIHDFTVIDTPTGPVSLMPGDVVLKDIDGDDLLPVRAQELVRFFIPITCEAEKLHRQAAATSGFRADLDAMEKDMADLSSGQPLIEQPRTIAGAPESEVLEQLDRHSRYAESLDVSPYISRVDPSLDFEQDLGVQPAGQLVTHEDGQAALTLVDDELEQLTDPPPPQGPHTYREAVNNWLDHQKWASDGGVLHEGDAHAA